MYEVVPVGACPGGECFLILGKEAVVLVDSGFDFCADKTVANIRDRLGRRSLDCILITHSHYDHFSGSAGIKLAYPQARVVAGTHAQKIAANPNARALMRSLNAECARDAAYPYNRDTIDTLNVDVVLEHGDELGLPGISIRAVATPGHTRCCLSYYLPEYGLLICGETLGVVPQYPVVVPCMIVGYESTLDSIDACRRLLPGRVFVSHHGLIPAGDEASFFTNARRAVEEAGRLLLDLSSRGCSDEEILEGFAHVYYRGSEAIQPRRAFDLNTQALIPRILPELLELARHSA